MSKCIFRESLLNLVNLKIKSPRAFASYLFSENLFFRKKAFAVQEQFKKYSDSLISTVEQPMVVNIFPYEGKNPYVIKMSDFLTSHLKDDLTEAIVHGSLGNYDEINYSDFDGLVIIRDEVFSNPTRLAAVARKLNESRKIMLGMDTLQHHGWLLLAGCELNNFDNSYFPAEIFNFSKSLIHQQPFSIKITQRSNNNYAESFYSICTSLLAALSRTNKINNLYQLKSILSRFMLLPSLYYQAKHKKGIFKKNSFEEVKPDFTQKEWKIMNEISLLRTEWENGCSSFQKKSILKFFYLYHKIIQPVYPRIKPQLKRKLNDQLFVEMKIFTETALLKIKSLTS